MYKVIEPRTNAEWERYYQLRWEVLRKPFQRPRGSEQDAYDQVGQHRMVVDSKGQALAVGRLHFNSPTEGQIRFMASAPERRGEGLGVAIVEALEKLAREQGAKHIIINSRDNTLGFYLRCGYELTEEADTVRRPQAEHQLRKPLTEANKITYRPNWCQELQQTWHREIPITEAMGIRIDQYTGREITLSAPLSRNINVHQSMFAGSIYSLATLTCWGLLHLQLKERDLSGGIVLADGQIEYRKPLKNEPYAISHMNKLEGEFAPLREGQNAHLTLTAEVFDEDKVVAEFIGKFVVLAPRD
ncbi:bifunctional GNAT family N-acetyltransferase/hotdog fold thioesterase [Pseudidiomarina taiwanensis]|uniref:GNAT family N-acetyltransferase n=1 Tax=Pseudidiomarina taiwanensis TaxID=337250 RepID=A0A432ZFE5_9GAMM|nr:bifunctional GNAT family N-acetyltransferase/hotdog fold thioesterase [Pseudidiomarina taiwanensis]RUO76687.1 GNAT family N-acetyltransferase [Pseudidiomarina taiwanensis]